MIKIWSLLTCQRLPILFLTGKKPTHSYLFQGQATQIPDTFYRTENILVIKMIWISENKHSDWRNALSIKMRLSVLQYTFIELQLYLPQTLEITDLISEVTQHA